MHKCRTWTNSFECVYSANAKRSWTSNYFWMLNYGNIHWLLFAFFELPIFARPFYLHTHIWLGHFTGSQKFTETNWQKDQTLGTVSPSSWLAQANTEPCELIQCQVYYFQVFQKNECSMIQNLQLHRRMFHARAFFVLVLSVNV